MLSENISLAAQSLSPSLVRLAYRRNEVASPAVSSSLLYSDQACIVPLGWLGWSCEPRYGRILGRGRDSTLVEAHRPMRRIRQSRHSRPPTIAYPSKKKGTVQKEPDETQANGHTPAVQEVTPKKALAEAICHLGADATHAGLAQFAKERFGLDLHFVIAIPTSTLKIASQGGRAGRSRARRKAG
jgi:hypothetical protein